MTISGSLFLRGVYMTSPVEGCAVGKAGVVLHYTGGTWTRFESSTFADLNSVYMVSPDEGWAVGAGVIIHYHNRVWDTYPLPDYGKPLF